MDRVIRKSGLNLALAGARGVLFFWLTDPVWGVAGMGRKALPKSMAAETPGMMSSNPIDAMNEASMGTTVGVVGSGAVLVFGLWIATRRTT